MKKAVMFLCVFACVMTLLVGCHTSRSYTWRVSTGDDIKIELDTSKGNRLTSDTPFNVLAKDGGLLTEGIFLTLNEYAQFADNAPGKSYGTGVKSNLEYVFWAADNTYYYAIKIDDSDTGILLKNQVSEASAREVFDLLTFQVVK